MKKHYGFSLAELIVVILVAAIIVVFTLKLINNSAKNKTALSLYYLYNQLQHANKTVVETLRKSKDDYKDYLQETILADVDSKTYCQAFADSVNTSGDIDCNKTTDGDIEVTFPLDEPVSPYIYNCNADIFKKVDDDGNLYITSTVKYDQNMALCKEMKNYLPNFYCQASTDLLGLDFMFEGEEETAPNYFFCQVDQASNAFEVAGVADVVEFDKVSSFKTFNNIYLNGKKVSTTAPVEMNFKKTVTTDPICDFLYNFYEFWQVKHSYHRTVVSGDDTACRNIGTGNCSSPRSPAIGVWFNGQGVKDNASIVTSLSETNSNYMLNIYGDVLYPFPEIYAGLAGTTGYYNSDSVHNLCIPGNCSEHIGLLSSFTPSLAVNCNSFLNLSLDSYNEDNNNVTKRTEYTFAARSNTPDGMKSWSFGDEIITVTFLSKIEIFNFSEFQKWQTKWRNYFKKYQLPRKQEKQKVEDKQVTVAQDSENKLTMKYAKHFIYASIGKPFDKAQLGKDIFIFEHFDGKIVPVGDLANDTNSPLRFHIYKHNTTTNKIERIVTQPDSLSYCQAMKIAGGEVSPYSQCKENSKLITKFEPDVQCKDGFGCYIKAVKPSFVSLWLPRK